MAGADFDDSHWRSAGERIQALIEACAADTPAAQARAEQLVREVVDLYGAALVRVMAAVDDPALADRLAADDLIGSLLLVHGVHPQDLTERVTRALDGVRPYLGSHGGDVQLLGIADGVVRLSFSGSCKSCPSSAVTLELAVEDAVRTAAPEIDSVEVGCRRVGIGDPGRLPDVAGACRRARAHHVVPGPRTGRTQPRRGGRIRPRRHRRAGVPGRRCGAGLPRPVPGVRRLAGRGFAVGRRCCAARAATPGSTWCTQAPAWGKPPQSAAGAGAGARRRAVHGGAAPNRWSVTV